jgi:organic radical activating enzyme
MDASMIDRPVFNKIEVYITNVCNLTCDQCNRFNNFDFKGWQRWSDHADQYKQWAKLIDLKAITIMGGEPLLNPTIVEWIHGLNDAFGIDVQILTNGTRLNKVPGLYEAIANATPRNGVRNTIAVSLHNLADLQQLQADIHDFLDGAVQQIDQKQNLWNSDYQYSDRNGVILNVYNQNQFDTSTVQVNQEGRYVLFDNNPVQAHDACTFVKFKSYHFIRGRLYKCGPAALLSEFDQQHPFDLSPADHEILHGYQPLTVANFAEYSEEFLANLDNPISQCKFCPTKKDFRSIFPIRKGTAKL